MKIDTRVISSGVHEGISAGTKVLVPGYEGISTRGTSPGTRVLVSVRRY